MTIWQAVGLILLATHGILCAATATTTSAPSLNDDGNDIAADEPTTFAHYPTEQEKWPANDGEAASWHFYHAKRTMMVNKALALDHFLAAALSDIRDEPLRLFKGLAVALEKHGRVEHSLPFWQMVAIQTLLTGSGRAKLFALAEVDQREGRLYRGNAFLPTCTGLAYLGGIRGLTNEHGFALFLIWSALTSHCLTDHSCWQDLFTGISNFMLEDQQRITVVDPTILEALVVSVAAYERAVQIKNYTTWQEGSGQHTIYQFILGTLLQRRFSPAELEVAVHKVAFLYDVDLMRIMLPETHKASAAAEYFVNAHILLYDGRLREAAIYLRLAIAAQPDNEIFRCYHAQTLGLMEDWAAAVQELETAVALVPESEYIKSRLQMARTRLHNAVPPLPFIPPSDPAFLPYLEKLGEKGRRDAVKAVGKNWEAAIADYEKQHIHDTTTAGPVGNRRFVVAIINEGIGMGNRLVGFMPIFMIALLTGRTMLIYWPNRPVPLKELFVFPPELKWDYLSIVEEHGWTPSIHHNSNEIELFATGDRWEQLDDLVCQDLNEQFNKTFLHVLANQDLLNLLRLNPRYAERMKELTGDDAFGAIGRYLLRPAPRPASIIASIQAKHRLDDENTHLIALHGRYGMVDADSQPYEGDDPAWRNLKNGAMIKTMMTDALVCSTQITDRIGEDFGFDTKRIVIYLSTDTLFAKKYLAKHLKLVNPDIKRVITQPISPERATVNGMVDAVVDLWMMSTAKDLIRSGKYGVSMYAMTASALGNIKAHIVLSTCTGRPENIACYPETHSQPILGTEPALVWSEEISNLTQATCFGGAGGIVKLIDSHGWWFPTCHLFAQRVREFEHSRSAIRDEF